MLIESVPHSRSSYISFTHSLDSFVWTCSLSLACHCCSPQSPTLLAGLGRRSRSHTVTRRSLFHMGTRTTSFMLSRSLQLLAGSRSYTVDRLRSPTHFHPHSLRLKSSIDSVSRRADLAHRICRERCERHSGSSSFCMPVLECAGSRCCCCALLSRVVHSHVFVEWRNCLHVAKDAGRFLLDRSTQSNDTRTR